MVLLVRGLPFRRVFTREPSPYAPVIEPPLTEYHRSWVTKSGRHIKPDAIPAAMSDYVDAYNQLMLYQHWKETMYPTPPQEPGFAPGGGGGRGGGGGGQKQASGNCGQHSLWWWGNQILDTGTPPGSSAPTAPAKLAPMGPIYSSNNLIFEKGTLYSVPAKNGVASGTRKPVPCTTFNHGMGWGVGFGIGTPNPYSQMSNEAIEAKLAYRRIWATTEWTQRHLQDLISTGGVPASASGWERGGGGGAGQRVISCTIAGKKTSVCIDTGTDAILGAGNGAKQCSIDPNPQTISVPSTSHSQGNPWFFPAYNMSLVVRVCLTSQYTIVQSLGSGGTIHYSAQGRGGAQQGDPTNGACWGTGGGGQQTQPQQQQAPQQQGRGGGGRQQQGWWYGY